MSVALQLPDELVDAIVDAVRERLVGEFEQVSPWMTRAQAAVYLNVPVSRLEKDRTVPCHRWDGRVVYHRGELDEWLLAMGAS